LKDLLQNCKSIGLKQEQEAAIERLVYGKDVLAILPTDFGKNQKSMGLGKFLTRSFPCRCGSREISVVILVH